MMNSTLVGVANTHEYNYTMAARSVAVAKKELRKRLKEALRIMTTEQRRTESANIVKQVCTHV